MNLFFGYLIFISKLSFLASGSGLNFVFGYISYGDSGGGGDDDNDVGVSGLEEQEMFGIE